MTKCANDTRHTTHDTRHQRHTAHTEWGEVFVVVERVEIAQIVDGRLDGGVGGRLDGL